MSNEYQLRSSPGEALLYRAAFEGTPREYVRIARVVGVDPRRAVAALDVARFSGEQREHLERLQAYVCRPALLRWFGRVGNG
jgi:hypothetical protein